MKKLLTLADVRAQILLLPLDRQNSPTWRRTTCWPSGVIGSSVMHSLLRFICRNSAPSPVSATGA